MKIKKHDFIKLDYIGRIKYNNQIFDLTNEETAKKEKIHNPEANYEPVVICVGENDIIPGIDEFLIGKDLGKYTLEITPEQGFGKKNAKLIRLIPLKAFIEKKINPAPGLQVNIDNQIGTIRTVSGGRCMVDFNHPLAGKNLIYEIDILSIVKDDKEKLKSLCKLHLHCESDLKEGKATIKIDLPKELQKPILKKFKELIPSIKEIKFEKQTNKAKTNIK